MRILKSVTVVLLLALSSIFVLSAPVNATENSNEIEKDKKEKEKIEKSHGKSKRQNEIRKELKEELKLEGLEKEHINEEGGFYFTANDGIVLQVKKEASNKEKHSKLEKVFKKLSNKSNSKFNIEYISYSQEELESLVINWFDLNPNIEFSENIIVRFDYLNNRVEVQTDELSQTEQNKLLKKYGNKIHLNIDPSLELSTSYSKERTDDWNKLGAGIAVRQYASGSCSTAGVARKDSRYFLLTAGHCIDAIGSSVLQYDRRVGTAHVDGRSRDYDIGLIEIELSGITRYAYNGLYTYDTNPSDYQGRLQHYDTPDNAETLCKSGITTGYTCGIVTTTAANVSGELNFELTDTDYGTNGWLAGEGDSGSAGFRSSNGYLIGIQSRIGRSFEASDGVRYASIAYFTPYKAAAASYGVSLYTSSTPIEISY